MAVLAVALAAPVLVRAAARTPAIQPVLATASAPASALATPFAFVSASATATAPTAPRWSQLAEVHFQHLTQDNGLPNSVATAVAEDGEGFVWVGTLGGLARWDGYRFRIYTAQPGTAGALPDNLIQALHTDAAGCLWVGTSSAGLARLDRDTDRFVVHGAGPQGLSHVSVRSIADDGTGGLWVATDGGLDHLDPATGTIVRGAADKGPNHGTGTGNGAGNGTSNGAHNGAGGANVGADSGHAAGLTGQRIQVLLRDRQGTLWAGTPDGLFRRPAGAQRFVLVPVPVPAAAQLPTQRQPPQQTKQQSDPPRQPQPESLFQDRSGRIWLGTQRDGAFVLRADGTDVRPVLETNALAAAPSSASTSAGSSTLQNQQVVSIAEGAPGHIWLATLGQGIVVVDAGSGLTRRVRRQPALPLSLADNAVRGLLRDRSGLLWVATNHGLSRHDTRQTALLTVFGVPDAVPDAAPDGARDTRGATGTATGTASVGRVQDPFGLAGPAAAGGTGQHQGGKARSAASSYNAPGVLPGTEISAILPTADGRIWLGTHRSGVHIVDPGGSSASAHAATGGGAVVSVLWPDAARPDSALPQDMVLALERAADGSVFIGTKRGLFRATADGQRVARVQLAGRDPAAPTWTLLADGSNTLWIGGAADGLWQLDTTTGASSPMLRDAAQSLTDQRITVLAHAEGGRLWIGTRNGVNRFDPATGALQRLLPAPGKGNSLSAGFVTAVHTDAQQRVWIGTYGGGVDILQADDAQGGPRFVSLGKAQGLPDVNVNAVLEDLAGQLWVGTDNGLARIDPHTLAVTPLRRAEGALFPTYWTGSAARTSAGELLFGGAGGLTVVRPEQVRPWAYRPATVITDLRVGGQAVPVGRFLGRDGRAVQTVTVPAQANSLLVEFSAMDYSAPERNRYAYRLEGFDDGWIEADATRRLAQYTNLPPGNYRLLLRGSNRDGAWADTPLALPVRVLPAWHQAWWFRALLVLAGAALLVAVVQLRTRLLLRQQAVLEHRVRERTAELEQVSKALEEKSRVLELSSISDPLTGLRNRRFLTQHIDKAIAASLRRATDQQAKSRAALPTNSTDTAAGQTDGASEPVDTDNVIFLIDVDHFKRVNDTHGHAAGDAVLVQFGRRLQQVMRESDYLVRWGGEEFLAVARDTDRARAEELAERLRRVVADVPFLLDSGQPLVMTCSVGFASVPFIRGEPRGLSWQEVVKLADLGLFAAKRVGRNAWVGLQAGPKARPQGLLVRVQAAPQAAVANGEISVVGNLPPSAVLQALAPPSS